MNRTHDRKEHEKSLRRNARRYAERFVIAVYLFRCTKRALDAMWNRCQREWLETYNRNGFPWQHSFQLPDLMNGERLARFQETHTPAYVRRLEKRGTLAKAVEAIRL